MSYKIEEVNGCTKKLVFSFDKLDLTKEITASIKQKQKESSLKGFRKGKAPLAMVEKLYRPQVESEALNRFVQGKIFEAITAEDLKVVGYPALENVDYQEGKSVSFDAMVEVFPTFEVKDMSKLSFKKDKVTVSAADVENVKKSYLSQRAEMVSITDKRVKLKKGQFAIMNFQGVTESGERPENMKGEEFSLEMGSGQFIPGFEDGMLGMKLGQSKEIELTFPADYHSADLQNAKVTFEVDLLEIKEKKFPEFTDEIAKEFGYESVEDFMTKNKESLTSQKERQVKEKLHQDILEKLVEENAFDVPVKLIEQQEQYLKEDLTRNLKTQGFNDDMVTEYFAKWTEDLSTKAKFQVCSGLILDKLAAQFNVETTDADLDAKIEETAKTSGLDIEQVKQYYTSDEKIKKNLMYAIREEKTFEKIVEQVKIK